VAANPPPACQRNSRRVRRQKVLRGRGRSDMRLFGWEERWRGTMKSCSFPGSAWEQAVLEALPPAVEDEGGAISKSATAEPRVSAFPGGAWEQGDQATDPSQPGGG
jgi:hypothetical protein